MIASPHTASRDERLCRLYAFADEVLSVCDALGIDPVLDGSLAVRAFTRDPTIAVRDIDLNCSEDEFPRLQRALEEAGIFCEIQDWHVLQARREGLKVEFGATEFWMRGIFGPYETLQLGNRAVRVVNREALRKLYQRGFDATAGNASEREKHEKIARKVRALDSASGEGDPTSGTLYSDSESRARQALDNSPHDGLPDEWPAINASLEPFPASTRATTLPEPHITRRLRLILTCLAILSNPRRELGE